MGMYSASFGWEISNLNGTGANVYFQVSNNMTLNSVDVDLAYVITTLPGPVYLAEILCQGAVSRGQVPQFDNSQHHDYLVLPQSPHFGQVTTRSLNGMTINSNNVLSQDEFMSVILKCWVPTDGTGAYTSRHVTSQPALQLNTGDYLVFHMDHFGVPGDVEMQVVLNYTTS